MIPLGDFNLPKAEASDGTYRALTSRGLVLPPHTSQIGSSIAADNHYDQIVFFPGSTQNRFTGATNVFDFDGALFRDLYETRHASSSSHTCATTSRPPAPVGPIPHVLVRRRRRDRRWAG